MKLTHLFCLLLICISCNRSKQPQTTISPNYESITKDTCVYYPIKDNKIAVDLKKPQQASIFDYFKHIELIPLETSNDVLIGKIGKFIEHQNRYYILDVPPGGQFIVYAFDATGKFIFKIDKRGKGPGEYTDLSDIIFNPFTGNIDLLNPWGFILSYDLSGNHVKTSTRVTNAELLVVHRLIALSEKMYVFLSERRQPFQVIYYDMEENKILHQEYEKNPVLQKYSHDPFYEYHGQWYFYDSFDNETYELGPNSLVKAYSWDFGKFTYDAKKMVFPNEDPKIVLHQFPYLMSVQGQNNRYVMAQIRLPDEERYANLIYDKSTQDCKYIGNFTESVEFRPLLVTNEYVLCRCYHGELDKYVNEEMLDETNRQKLEALMKVRGELNPVIIKYYFK